MKSFIGTLGIIGMLSFTACTGTPVRASSSEPSSQSIARLPTNSTTRVPTKSTTRLPEEVVEDVIKDYALSEYPSDETCERAVEIVYDDMTDLTSIISRETSIGPIASVLVIFDSKKKLHEGVRDTRSLNWGVSGDDGCIDEHSSILVLFEDGTRMERKNKSGFSCSSGLVSTEFRKIQPHNSRYFKDNFIFSGEEANRSQEYKDSKLRQYDALMKDMWIRNKAENEEKEQEWVKLATSKVSKIRVTGASTKTDAELTDEQSTQLMNTFACFHKEFYQAKVDKSKSE